MFFLYAYYLICRDIVRNIKDNNIKDNVVKDNI